MQETVIKKLRELSEGLKDIQAKKMDAIINQRYEIAAEYRNTERSIYVEIDELVKLREEDFDSNEMFNSVKKNLYQIIEYIEDGDTNLTPALIRKLTNDVTETNEAMKWTRIQDKRPEPNFEVEINGNSCLQSEEVIVLYVTEDGKCDVCIGRYVVEQKYIHDMQYYFITRNPNYSIRMSDIKGWQRINGEARAWVNTPAKA